MENGDILDSQIAQPNGSHKGGDINNAPWQARLNNPTGNTWISANPSVAALVVDLIDSHRVLGIDAHGNNKFPSKPGYPTNFEIQYLSGSSSPSWDTALTVSIIHRCLKNAASETGHLQKMATFLQFFFLPNLPQW